MDAAPPDPAATPSSTVLLLDTSLSMPMCDAFEPAKEAVIALHAVISRRRPAAFVGIVGYSDLAREVQPQELPELGWDFVYGTNLQHGLQLSRELLAGRPGTRRIILFTDGEVTAHLLPDGEVYFNSPPDPASVDLAIDEVARCVQEGIRVTAVIFRGTVWDRRLVESIKKLDGVRVSFTDEEAIRASVRRLLSDQRAGAE